jgi:hypothetical protein
VVELLCFDVCVVYVVSCVEISLLYAIGYCGCSCPVGNGVFLRWPVPRSYKRNEMKA